MSSTWASWLYAWRWSIDLSCWVYRRVRCTANVLGYTYLSYSRWLNLFASFSSHFSVKGNCILEWFRLHDDGSKGKLIADGKCALSVILRPACYHIQLLFLFVWAELMFNRLSFHRMSRSYSSWCWLPNWSYLYTCTRRWNTGVT